MTLTLDTTWTAMGDAAIVTDRDDNAVRYVAWHDADSDCPNDWDDSAHVYVYATSSRGTSDYAGEDAVSNAFYRVYGEHDAVLALTVARRYAVAFLGWTAEQAESGIVTYSARGYSQSDWWDVLAVSQAGYAASAAQTWEQWARGDVWAVMREDRIECGSEDCHGDDDAHWEAGDTLGGIYACDAEEAASYAMSNGLG